MKIIRKILMAILVFLPTIVSASDGNNGISIGVAIGMEVFMSFHMSLLVLRPMTMMIKPDDSKKMFWILFAIRVIVLLLCDFFVTPNIAIVDFIAVFIGVFIIVPITSAITKKPISMAIGGMADEINKNTLDTNATVPSGSIILKCTKCGNILNVNDKACAKCGTPFKGDNAQVVQDTSPIVPMDNTYLANEKIILKNMIIAEIRNQGENEKTLTNIKTNKKKNIWWLIYTLLTVLIVVMYFFNYSITTCILIEAVVAIIYAIVCKKLNVVNILMKKSVKEPTADISMLVKNIKEEKKNLVLSTPLKVLIAIIIAVIIPSAIFFNPKVLYQKVGDGYYVFRYTRGLTYNEEVTIPSTHNRKNVIGIGEKAFINSTVKKVNLPTTLTTIKTKAFYNCSKLEQMIIPKGVTEIRGSTFENCTNLIIVSLPEGLLDIRGSVFKNCTKLTNVKLPNSLEYLGASAFSHCNSITEMTIPKNVTEINGQTFEYCTSLRKINLHDNITSIHGAVFMECNSLNNVILPSKITEIRGNTFECCSSLTSIIIPEGVTRIGGHAFYGCSSLSYVSVPSTVVEIGSSAFRQCFTLRSIYIPCTALVNEKAFKESPTRIYCLDENNYNYINNKENTYENSKYLYTNEHYFTIGHSTTASSNALTSGVIIKLENININNNKIEYEFKYSGMYNGEFILDNEVNTSKTISNNIMVKIVNTNETSIANNNGISLMIYYN
ncbi:MAG: leucine-rich repeat protein [Bacilli bacterium]